MAFSRKLYKDGLACDEEGKAVARNCLSCKMLDRAEISVFAHLF